MDNTLAHGVDFGDSDIRKYSSNVIAENFIRRANADGHVSMSLQATINHRKDNTAFDLKHNHVYTNNQRKLR